MPDNLSPIIKQCLECKSTFEADADDLVFCNKCNKSALADLKPGWTRNQTWKLAEKIFADNRRKRNAK